MQLVLHVIGNGTVPTRRGGFGADAFNEMAMRFSTAMMRRGHKVIYYGNCPYDGHIACHEYENVATHKITEALQTIEKELGQNGFNRGDYLSNEAMCQKKSELQVEL